MSMSHANDQNAAVGFDLVDHQMGLHGMDPNRRRQFQALACGERIVGKKLEGVFQQCVVKIGLINAKLFGAE